MTAAISSLQSQLYVLPIVLPDAEVSPGHGSPDSSSTAAVVQFPVGQTAAPLLSSETVSALVAEQSVASTPPVTDAKTPMIAKPYSSYEAYMPTREGFSAYDLAAAVSNRDYVSSSAGKIGADIASDARARMDEKYASMAGGGEAFAYSSQEGRDWYTLMGELDPKSLTAVSDNVGGLFTEQEQGLGKYFLDIQESFRLGGYNGPSRLFGQFVASGASFYPKEEAAKTMKSFDDESAKQTDDFGLQLGRASMRTLLGDAVDSLGLSAENRMMTFLVGAMRKAQADDPNFYSKLANVRTADDLKKQDWFHDKIEQFDTISKDDRDALSKSKASLA